MTTKTYPKTVKTVWTLYLFDAVGNSEDGFEVNQSFNMGEIELTLKVEVFNKDTEREFPAAYPTDYQIKKLVNFWGKISLGGDDVYIDIEKEKDGYPLGRLVCESHGSLSPVYFHYAYHVDLDERGVYYAHVEDSEGKTVFNVNNENEDGESGEISLIEDGYMRHAEDMSGLLEYLQNMGILPPYSTLEYKG